MDVNIGYSGSSRPHSYHAVDNDFRDTEVILHNVAFCMKYKELILMRN